MERRQRRTPDPILMGEPSPSLAKINKMNMRELAERIWPAWENLIQSE